jgi:hypothetical protein
MIFFTLVFINCGYYVGFIYVQYIQYLVKCCTLLQLCQYYKSVPEKPANGVVWQHNFLFMIRIGAQESL